MRIQREITSDSLLQLLFSANLNRNNNNHCFVCRISCQQSPMYKCSDDKMQLGVLKCWLENTLETHDNCIFMRPRRICKPLEQSNLTILNSVKFLSFKSYPCLGKLLNEVVLFKS